MLQSWPNHPSLGTSQVVAARKSLNAPGAQSRASPGEVLPILRSGAPPSSAPDAGSGPREALRAAAGSGLGASPHKNYNTNGARPSSPRSPDANPAAPPPQQHSRTPSIQEDFGAPAAPREGLVDRRNSAGAGAGRRDKKGCMFWCRQYLCVPCDIIELCALWWLRLV